MALREGAATDSQLGKDLPCGRHGALRHALLIERGLAVRLGKDRRGRSLRETPRFCPLAARRHSVQPTHHSVYLRFLYTQDRVTRNEDGGEHENSFSNLLYRLGHVECLVTVHAIEPLPSISCGSFCCVRTGFAKSTSRPRS
jgi:hypothetical protein